MDVTSLVFYLFSSLLLVSAANVIFSRQAVSAVLSLIVSFLSAMVLWLILHAEFLGLALLFVYVGAVMTLFLFVVMMLNVKLQSQYSGLLRRLPLAVLAGVALVGLIVLALGNSMNTYVLDYPENYNNTVELGKVLYTDYLVPLELAAIILLVAIIAAIGLAFRGAQNRKQQDVPEQILASKARQLRIVSMKSERGS